MRQRRQRRISDGAQRRRQVLIQVVLVTRGRLTKNDARNVVIVDDVTDDDVTCYGAVKLNVIKVVDVRLALAENKFALVSVDDVGQ